MSMYAIMKLPLHDGLLARQRPSKLVSALASLRHCHPKYELFSPDRHHYRKRETFSPTTVRKFAYILGATLAFPY